MAAKLLAALIASLFVASAFGETVVVRRRSDRVHPCKNDTTAACVREFVRKHSDCSRINPVAATLDPLVIDHSVVDAAFFNVTGDWYNVSITGLSKNTVKDFMYNKTSKQAVLTVHYPAFTAKGNLAINVLSIDNEIVTFDIRYTLFYKDVTITTVFRNYTNIDASTSVSIAYLPHPPTNSYGTGFAPEVIALADQYPEVQDLVNQRKLHPDVFAVESFRYRAPVIAQAFFSANLCSA